MWLIAIAGLIIYTVASIIEFLIENPIVIVVLLGLYILAVVINAISVGLLHLAVIMLIGFVLFMLIFSMLGFK